MIADLHLGVERRSPQHDGVNADMQQDFDAGLRFDADRVLCFIDHRDLASYRAVNFTRFRRNRHAVP